MSDERESMGGAEDGSGVFVNPVAFEELMAAEAGPAAAKPEGSANLDLIMDVEVSVTACLGYVKKTLGDILSLGEGHVVDLERSAGEPVDLLVNGRLVAKGEVVVVDERYGVRVTEIVAPAERLAR